LSHCEWVLSSIIGRFFAYISSAIVGVLLLLTLLDSNILLYFDLWGRGLVWYLAVFSAILALSRSMITETQPGTKTAKEALKELLKYAHYLPQSWLTSTNLPSIKLQFQSLYQSKLTIMFHEIVNVIFTPFILMFTLPNCAEEIIHFIQDNTITVPGLGDVFNCARFKMDDGDESYQPMNVSLEHRPNHPLKEGKMEKSVVTFAMNNPNWKTDEKQTNLLASVVEIIPDNLNQPNCFLPVSPSLSPNSPQSVNNRYGSSPRLLIQSTGENNPMNMSFSTLLGAISQNDNSKINNEMSMYDEFQGIDLLASLMTSKTQILNRREYEKNVQMKCSNIFLKINEKNFNPDNAFSKSIQMKPKNSIEPQRLDFLEPVKHDDNAVVIPNVNQVEQIKVQIQAEPENNEVIIPKKPEVTEKKTLTGIVDEIQLVDQNPQIEHNEFGDEDFISAMPQEEDNFEVVENNPQTQLLHSDSDSSAIGLDGGLKQI